MKKQFTIESPMPPIWIMYPYITQYSIGWRMGYGEGYKDYFFDWFKTLTKKEQQEYDKMFPKPVFWRNLYENDIEDDEIESYVYENILFWEKDGLPKYFHEELISNLKKSNKYIFFWQANNEVVDKSCFGQWRNSVFKVDAEEYFCAEQYMMAQKAGIFGDKEIEMKIMNSSTPKEIKALGRKVKNFDQKIWDKVKYSVVLNGNYYKFTQNKEMRDFLLSTEDKILVEASPLDKIWGIGIAESSELSTVPNKWKGQNLLGFALMEVRDELRRLYKNYDKIDWHKVKENYNE